MKNIDKLKSNEPITKEYFSQQLKFHFEDFARVVAKGFADERKYMDKRFKQVDKRFEQIDLRFEQVDKRFEQVDKRFQKVDEQFGLVDKKFNGVKGESRSIRSEMRHEFGKVNGKIDEVKKSLDFLNQQRMIDIDAIREDSIKHSKRIDGAEKNILALDKRVAKLEVTG